MVVLISILCLVMIWFVQARPLAASEVRTAAQSSVPAPTPEQTSIPVATGTGIVPMSQSKYDEYVKSMGHLPVMTKSYIFGHTIQQPKTDKDGNIHVSNPPPAAPGGAAAPRPAREPARP
jgi:hypothetical protein